MGKLRGIILYLEVWKSFPLGMSHSALEVVEFVLATARRIIKLAYSSKVWTGWTGLSIKLLGLCSFRQRKGAMHIGCPRVPSGDPPNWKHLLWKKDILCTVAGHLGDSISPLGRGLLCLTGCRLGWAARRFEGLETVMLGSSWIWGFEYFVGGSLPSSSFLN